jgi:hypothetical protein
VKPRERPAALINLSAGQLVSAIGNTSQYLVCMPYRYRLRELSAQDRDHGTAPQERVEDLELAAFGSDPEQVDVACGAQDSGRCCAGLRAGTGRAPARASDALIGNRVGPTGGLVSRR